MIQLHAVYKRLTWNSKTQAESERMKKIVHANSNQKRVWMALLISDKIDFQSKKLTREKEGHYILIKSLLQQEDIAIMNIYTPNDRLPIYMKQKHTELKGKIDNYTVIVGDFSTLLTIIDRIIRHK